MDLLNHSLGDKTSFVAITLRVTVGWSKKPDPNDRYLCNECKHQLNVQFITKFVNQNNFLSMCRWY